MRTFVEKTESRLVELRAELLAETRFADKALDRRITALERRTGRTTRGPH